MEDVLVDSKLLIIDVDALLGTKHFLHYPQLPKLVWDKNPSFCGKDSECPSGRWYYSDYYNRGSILTHRSELSVVEDNCCEAILPAIDKLAGIGWLFSFWTTRSKQQTFHIIDVLWKTGIWQKSQMFSGTPLLLNNNTLGVNEDFSIATAKLTLFEKVYGKIYNPGCPLVSIESDPLEVNILQSYGGKGIVVHLSPKIWLDVLVSELENIDELLMCPQFRESITPSVDQAS
jgi:hypothetical protein